MASKSRSTSGRPAGGRPPGPGDSGAAAAARRAKAAAARQAELRAQRQRRAIWISATAVALVVVVVVVLVVVRTSGGGKKSTALPSGPASATVVNALRTVPAATLEKVGVGSASPLPKTISAPALTADGKPRVLYIGAEYCPFCAAERWPMAIALSRFGTFQNLGFTHSASGDVYPNTATLSFHGATYTSDYLSFTGVETTTNVKSGDNYKPLDTPAAADEQLLATYDVPPYVDSSSSGAIPFVDLGGKFLISGASYSPQVLAGKTQEQIAAALTNPNDAITKAVLGTANVITAALCTMTGGKPANVCNTPSIGAIQAQLTAGG